MALDNFPKQPSTILTKDILYPYIQVRVHLFQSQKKKGYDEAPVWKMAYIYFKSI